MSHQFGDLFDPELQSQQVLKIPNKCTKTKALSSIPDVLIFKKVGDCVRVFAKRSLSRATQFGPLDAPLVTKNEVDESKFLIKLNIEKCKRLENVDAAYIYYDTTDENMCNWMMFVRPAKFFAEQNLCAHQEEDFIFYTTTREISPDEELKVWYSPSYAKFMSVSVLTPTSGIINIPNVGGAKKSGRKPKTSIRMQVYINSMVSERDVRSVPPKKRGWRRSKDPKRSGGNNSSCHMYPNSSEPKRVVRKTFVRIPKTFECLICRKTFKTGNKLRIHSVAHYAERNFLCHFCGLTYKRSDKLQEHIANKHRTNVVKVRKEQDSPNLDMYQFKCTDCGTGFHRRGMFINHIINKHPDLRTSDFAELNNPILKTVRDFFCSYCGKVYKSSSKRKLHILKDHPGRKLPPSIRKKKNGVVDGEAAVVSKEQITVKPVSCPYCEGQYTTKYKMKKHVREKHQGADSMICSSGSSGADAQQQQPMQCVNQVAYVVDHTQTQQYMDISLSHKQGIAVQVTSNDELLTTVTDQTPDELQAAYEALSGREAVNVNIPETCNTAHENGRIDAAMPMSHHQDSLQRQVYAVTQGEINAPNQNDLLTQAMSALEPPDTAEPIMTTTFQSAKCNSYSRCAGGRKQMLLKSYENGQNAAAVRSEPSMAYAAEKQLPYKNRVLNSFNMCRQTTLPAESFHYNQNTLPEISSHNTVQQYHIHYPAVSPTNTMLDSNTETFVLDGVRPHIEIQAASEQSTSQESLLQGICSTQHVDSASLETSDLAAIYHNSSAVNWSYAAGEAPMQISYISR